MIINADLHVHGRYSMATSKNMVPETMAAESSKKGLDLIATGDALHSGWLNTLEESLTETKDGIYRTVDTTDNNSTSFITTTEVEDNERIHHLIIIPSIDAAWQMRDEFTAKNMDADGRPKLRMNAGQIIEIAHDYGCMMGPAHIFTPWTGMYKSYDTISECYHRRPDFVELGLSSDTYLADTIEELKDYTFLTNSDSHSPWPHRMGREFNRIDMADLSFGSLKDAIRNNRIVENYGYDPRMGKYHLTGCARCYRAYSLEEATKLKMRCSCGGQIKKGVKSRIEELAAYSTPHHPKDRPRYRYILPLAELLSTIHGKGVTTKYVQSRYNILINEFGTEINVLLDVPLEEIAKIDGDLSGIIGAYRQNRLDVTAGRGGQYGTVRYG